MGDSEEMRKAIQLLDEVKESIINAYAIKTGLSRTKLSNLMDSETWMNANKAMELGFCDEIMFQTDAHVYTHFAGKRVNRVFGTEESNAFSLLDTSSVFLQLEPRRNLLRYNAAENMDLLEVTILYRPKFLGV